MMLLPIAKATAGAVTATLALSSGRNMLQTFQISRAHQETADTKTPWIPPSLHRHLSDPDPTFTTVTANSVVNDLEELGRKELVELFLTCQTPTNAAEIEGEWNGVLLENNGFVLTSASNILTNKLFGRGRQWNGKAFFEDGKGVNRFYSKSELRNTEKEHSFDYTVEETRIIGSNGESVLLRYDQYQSGLSLWRSMKDEIRLLPLPEDVGGQVLLGMGWMTWSGGILNASPFCLWREAEPKSSS